MNFNGDQLTQQLSTVIDPSFSFLIVTSYIEMEQRFLAGDWQPAELDAGRLCEAVSRALLQIDIGKISNSDLPNAIQTMLLDQKNPTHSLDRKDRYHICKAIEVVYKFRSDRGPVHISSNYSANYMDSMFVLHAGKWIFAEFLRLALKQDAIKVGAIIEQLVQMEHSIIHELDGKPLVLIPNIAAGEEVLLLLGHKNGNKASRAELIADASNQNPSTVRSAITALINRREVRIAQNQDIVLTPSGQKRIREQIIPKYTPE